MRTVCPDSVNASQCTGKRPTRYSLFLISLGTPMIMGSQRERRGGFILTGDHDSDVAGADCAKFISNGPLGEFGSVAIATEVREEHVSQLVTGDVAQIG